MNRYEKNGIFTAKDMVKLKKARVCVIGCGGLGGYIIEMLARAGIGFIRVVDGDVFDQSNLNRQLLSHTQNLGKSKVSQAMERIHLINPEIETEGIEAFITQENVEEYLKTVDIVMDALDQIPVRFILNQCCKELGIPMVYGAIAGWYGQVTTIMPEDDTLSYLYPDYQDKRQTRGIEVQIGNPSFTPALIASIQVSECLKWITSKGELLIKQVLYMDLRDNEMMILPVGD